MSVTKERSESASSDDLRMPTQFFLWAYSCQNTDDTHIPKYIPHFLLVVIFQLILHFIICESSLDVDSKRNKGAIGIGIQQWFADAYPILPSSLLLPGNQPSFQQFLLLSGLLLLHVCLGCWIVCAQAVPILPIVLSVCSCMLGSEQQLWKPMSIPY